MKFHFKQSYREAPLGRLALPPAAAGEGAESRVWSVPDPRDWAQKPSDPSAGSADPVTAPVAVGWDLLEGGEFRSLRGYLAGRTRNPPSRRRVNLRYVEDLALATDLLSGGGATPSCRGWTQLACFRMVNEMLCLQGVPRDVPTSACPALAPDAEDEVTEEEHFVAPRVSVVTVEGVSGLGPRPGRERFGHAYVRVRCGASAEDAERWIRRVRNFRVYQQR